MSPASPTPPQPDTDVYVEQRIPPDRPNPLRADIWVRRITFAPWWLLLIGLMIGYLYNTWAGNDIYVNAWESVRQGIEVTIFVTTRGYALALLMGLGLAVARMSANPFIYQGATFYVEVVRGVPTLILVYYIALAATGQLVQQVNLYAQWLVDQGLDPGGNLSYLAGIVTRDIDNRYRVIVALAISYSAFLSEVFRAGLESIPKGQIEAAQSLGLGRVQTFRLVILPQAFRVILPPLGNDFIAMLKESSLVSVVGVEDVTRRGVSTAQASFRFFEIYNVVAMTYLVLTLMLALGVRALEAYIDAGVRYTPANLIRRCRAWLARRDPAQPDVPPSKGPRRHPDDNPTPR